jgi:predicted nucleotidyltransferase
MSFEKSSANPIILHLPDQTLSVKKGFIAELRLVLTDTPEVLFAVLVGSRANGSATENSDWDIAIQWQYGDALERIARHELMRHRLARILEAPDEPIDLIDLSNARLAMRALVAEEGFLLVVNDELAWAKFLTRTWRELEDFYWERAHAA